MPIIRQSYFMLTRIAFVNGKGGVGKTTCAILLAATLKAAGWPVSIDDRDPQRSATTAGAIFGVPVSNDDGMVIIDTAPNIQKKATKDTVPNSQKEAFKDNVSNIQEEATLEAIRTANLVVLVTSPSPLDVATTVATAERIQAERRGLTRVLFNMVHTNNRFFKAMEEMAKQLPFPVCRHFLVRRTAYQTAQIQGWNGLTSAARVEFGAVAVELMQALPKECRTR